MPNPKRVSAKTKKLVRELLRKKRTRTWRQIAEQDYGGKIHFSVLNRIVVTGGAYLPTSREQLYLLGLYKPRRMTPKTIANTEAGQSWTLYMRSLVKGIRTPTPKQLSRKVKS